MGVCVSRRRRSSEATMAHTINMNLPNPIRVMVSKRRKRYTKDGFNLDLAYITERLIAMGYPADKLEGVYRNHIDDVFKFLELKHNDNYWIYNLCKERSYDVSRFHERVSTYAFDDHNPPNITQIRPFCDDVHKWLSQDPKNVAAVHCKAGKGRTGTMVCCYLLHSGMFKTADEALNYYGQKRAHDKKGVTIPSQRRYVQYYAALMSSQFSYRDTVIRIHSLSMTPPPLLNSQGTLELCISQVDSSNKISGRSQEVRKGDSCVSIALDACTALTGDVKVEVYSKPKMMRKEKLFHFWFNSFLVTQDVDSARVDPPEDSQNLPTYKLCLDKWQLDDAHKDKQHKLYSSDFKVELIVQEIPKTSNFSGLGRTGCPAPSQAPSTVASTTSDSSGNESGDETWDSGEQYNTLNGHQINNHKHFQLERLESQLVTSDRQQNDLENNSESDHVENNHPQRPNAADRPVTYPMQRDLEAFTLGSNWLLELRERSTAVTSATDLTQACAEEKTVTKIPKVSSDHTISSNECKEQKGKKYKFFHASKKESSQEEEVELRSPSSSERRMSSEAGFSRPRLSLGDVRASWREFSGKHFGMEHTKYKKKTLPENSLE